MAETKISPRYSAKPCRNLVEMTWVSSYESNTKELLDMVARGESVTITYQGKPLAKLISFENKLGEENTLFGIWADHEASEDVNAYIRTIRSPHTHE